MAIDIKSIFCQQCGSKDIKMISETHGVCNVCGTRFMIQQNGGTQNIFNMNYGKRHSKIENPCTKAEIIPEYNTKDFLRKLWISVANDNAPIEAFDENFSEVIEINHQVFMDDLDAEVSYQAEVGTDRQEPYIDYETYYDEEPYVTTEQHFNSLKGVNEERVVTRYNRVKKERQVTRYKTVTDWRPFGGTHSVESVAIVENNSGLYLDTDLFVDSLKSKKDTSIRPIDGEEANAMQIAESARREALDKHNSDIEISLAGSIPGDYNRNVSFTISDSSSDSMLLKAKEYQASIIVKGRSYKKHAFPFGDMRIGGDIIRDDVILEDLKEKEINKNKSNMQNAIDNRKAVHRDEKAESEKALKMKLIIIVVMAIAALIIGTTLTKSSRLLPVLFVLGPVGVIILGIIWRRKENERLDSKHNELMRFESEEITKQYKEKEKEIKKKYKNMINNHKTEVLNALNNKLTSLEFEPAMLSDISANSYLDIKQFSKFDSKGEALSMDFDITDSWLVAAIIISVEEQKASASLFQRRMNIGYAKAASLIDTLEGLKIVGAYDNTEPRKVLLSRTQWGAMLQENEELAINAAVAKNLISTGN